MKITNNMFYTNIDDFKYISLTRVTGRGQILCVKSDIKLKIGDKFTILMDNKKHTFKVKGLEYSSNDKSNFGIQI